jgi:dephospho-CoA kinase
VILVTAPYIEKIKRLTRKKYTKKRINDVMKNQWKDSIKIPLTNYVIENIDLEKTKLQVVNLHNQFMLRN